MSEKQIFTLKQVVLSIKKAIDDRYSQAYWVKAEMHKLNRFPSGHCFPELVQKENGKIVAQMTGTIWKTNIDRINKQFIEIVKEPLKEGTTLLLLVRVTFSEIYGLGLQIMDIDPSYVLGELQREREETLKRLQKEGLLNANQQVPFPLLPKRVAIISAEASKGLSDFMKVLTTNPYGFHFSTHLFQAYLQGDLAAASIAKQLDKIAKVKEHFDVVVIVRGGGGEVGMTCYNNYQLCHKIASFPLPVLTGIGHSTNLTVAEMVAFQNGITPTELAEMLMRCFHEVAVPLENAIKMIKRTTDRIIKTAEKEIQYASKLFRQLLSRQFSESKSSLNFLSKNVHIHVKNRMHQANIGLKDQEKSLLKSFYNWKEEKANELQKENERILREAQFLLKDHNKALVKVREALPPVFLRYQHTVKQNLLSIEHSVQLLSPVQVLKRGYSISRVNGKVISKGNPVRKGDKITIFTEEFELESEVKQVKKTKDE
jgi:exodeoxyribonuclease VII large subunit